MEDLKYLTNKNSVYQITSAMQKIAKAIRLEKAQNIKDTNIKEIDFLKEQCLNENVQLSLLSYQTFVRLVEDGTLEAPFVLSMFVSMLPSASVCQYTALSEGVISLLLLDLKRRSILMKSNDEYVCPFGLKPPQHPLIMLFQKKDANMNDLANKINGICSHHDKDIRGNSIEFLRPVFLFILCNPNIVPDSKTMWTCLLSHSKKSSSAQALVYDILFWSNTSTAASCLYTSILLTEVIDFMLNQQKYSNAIELTVYLACLLCDLIKWGYDPRPGLAVIMNVLYRASDSAQSYLNVLLVLLAQTLHSISPIYMSDLTRLLRLIVITMEGGNAITLNMLVDGLIIWLANPSFIADGLSDAQAIVQHITSVQYKISGKCKVTLPSKVKYFHPDFAFGYDLAVLSEELTVDWNDGRVEDFVESLNQPAQFEFCDKINLFIRALFLWDHSSEKVYVSLIEILCRIVRRNETVAIDFILPWLYKLSSLQGAVVQLELLRGLTNFAVVKENIPIILNTLKSISTGSLKPLAMDLYLRLWKCENRTYSFLHTLLSVPYENESAAWELNVAKAHTIKEICELKPAQHGTDLVVHLSNILNNCSTSRGEAATAIALEAIIALCYSHTVNIASTWKALSVRFQNETRIRPLISLCNFFGKVPLLRSPTPEYELLHADAMSKLWNYVALSDNGLIISAALTALQNFDYTEVPLIQIPDVYRQGLLIPTEFTKIATEAGQEPFEVMPYIPGECWLQVIQYANHSAINDAAALVGHLIYREIDGYRSGVYTLPEGHPEPSSLSRLNKQSPLRAVVKFLLAQSNGDGIASTDIVIVACLKAVSKKFPKPMPPLNWFFLLEFMSRSLDMKQLCLRITANQIMQSGSAKNILENYMTAFKATECLDPEEIDYCFEMLPDLVTDIATAVFKPFVEHIFAYALTQAETNGFSKGCLLEKALRSAEDVFQKQSTNVDNVNVVIDVIKRFMNLIDLDSEIFIVFTSACASLPSNVIETLTIPTTSSSATQFQKFTIIRCFLAKKPVNKSLENPLMWLNIIVDSTVQSNVDQTFVLENLASILHQHESHRSVCNWVMEILGKVQAALSNKTTENEAYCLFLIDVFVLSVVVVSGLANTFTNPNTVATSRTKRLDIFGEALHILCQRDFWSENVIRIYEFLYHIYVNADLPVSIIEATKNALLCSKGQSYFQAKGVWMKFVGLRKVSKPACF